MHLVYKRNITVPDYLRVTSYEHVPMVLCRWRVRSESKNCDSWLAKSTYYLHRKLFLRFTIESLEELRRSKRKVLIRPLLLRVMLTWKMRTV